MKKMYNVTKILEKLSTDEDVEIRRFVAENSDTSAKTLAKDEDVWVRRYVAGNTNTPIEALEGLATDSDAEVRKAVDLKSKTKKEKIELAKDSNTPAEILEALSTDESFEVQYNVAKNPNTTVEVLIKLSMSESSYVHKYAAENPKIPTDILKKLARNKNVDVRKAVAGNPKTLIETLEMLVMDEDEVVCLNAACNQDYALWDKMIATGRKFSIDQILNVANDCFSSPESLATIESVPYYGVRVFLAQNCKTPAEVLAKLAMVESLEIPEGSITCPDYLTIDYKKIEIGRAHV